MPRAVEDGTSNPAAVRRDSVTQPGKFTWTPLGGCEEDIRICSIIPGPDDAPVEVVLRNARLEEHARQYACLSYSWGDKTTVRGLVLNGFAYTVPGNLHLHLTRLRALGVTQDLWIDLLCIDQANLAERSQQVRLMGRIFSNAKMTFLAVDEGGQVLQPSAIEKAFLDLSHGSHLHDLRSFSCDDTGQEGTSPGNNIATQQLRRILVSSFWTRCWTVQETVLAREAVLMGEWGTFSWVLLREASLAYDYHRQNCCVAFVDSVTTDIRSGCYQVGNQNSRDLSMGVRD